MLKSRKEEYIEKGGNRLRYLQTLFDHSLHKEYKLYQANARELSDRLKKGYNLPPVMFQLFNSESELGRNIQDIKKLKSKGRTLEKDDLRIENVRKSVKKIKANEHVSEMTKQGIHFGYEIMPIAVSTKGEIENPETLLELVDGFKRMFCADIVPDIDILVKVYGELDNREWINAMLLYNSWKFADGLGASRYMDRGFQLGLYYRYRMLFVNMVAPSWGMFHFINLYTKSGDLQSYWTEGADARGVYQTFWNNSCFYDDIQAIYEIVTYRPIFQLKKRGKIEEYDSNDAQYKTFGMRRMLEVFVSLLGEIRRHEWTNDILERKPFNRAILKDYFAEPDGQKQFVKLLQMSVDGHIINHIKTHMREDMKKRMYEGMGYEYVPQDKKVSYQKTVTLSDIHF